MGHDSEIGNQVTTFTGNWKTKKKMVWSTCCKNWNNPPLQFSSALSVTVSSLGDCVLLTCCWIPEFSFKVLPRSRTLIARLQFSSNPMGALILNTFASQFIPELANPWVGSSICNWFGLFIPSPPAAAHKTIFCFARGAHTRPYFHIFICTSIS